MEQFYAAWRECLGQHRPVRLSHDTARGPTPHLISQQIIG